MQTETAQDQAQAGTESPDFSQDLYEVLQISPRAELEIIEAAYKKLAQKYHPDKNPAPDATLKMQQINSAYAILSNPERREEYDRYRALEAKPYFRPATPYRDPGFHASNPVEEPVQSQEIPKPAYDWNSLEYRGPRPMDRWLLRTGYILAGIIFGTIIFMAIMVLNSNSSGTPTATPSLASDTIFSDNFDFAGSANWNLDSPWHLTGRFAAGAGNSLWVGDESRGRYNPGLNVSATLLRPVDLSQTTNPALVFDFSGQTDDPANPSGKDKLAVEIAEPGQDFIQVKSVGGLYSNWQTARVNLNAWKGKVILVRLRFISGPDNSYLNFSGFFIDNFRIVSKG